MMKILKNLKLNKSGASAAEYALIVAVLGGLVVTGATSFGDELNGVLTDAGTAMKAETDKDFSTK